MTRAVLLATALLAGCASGPPTLPGAPEITVAADLAYLENDGTTAHVVCLDLLTETRTPLTRGDSSVYGPRWVPGLGRLVVASTATAPATLLAIDPADGSADALWANPAADEVPAWTPDATRVVFSLPTATGRALVLADADGMEIRRLTDGAHTDKQPTVSPDGRRIAFVSDRSGSDDVWTLDLRTGALSNATAHPASEGHPAWHPDGERLLLYRFENGDADLVTVRPGAEAVPVRPGPGFQLVGRFSPDGEALAFGSAETDDWELYLALANGSGLRRLTQRDGFDGDAVWLPDGTCPG